MIQQIIVGLIVALAAFAVAKRYAPKGMKRAARAGTVRLAKALGWHWLADKLAQKAEAGASCGDGCGSCGNCAPSENEKNASTQTVSVESLKQSLRR
jgi:hypothetical protein